MKVFITLLSLVSLQTAQAQTEETTAELLCRNHMNSVLTQVMEYKISDKDIYYIDSIIGNLSKDGKLKCIYNLDLDCGNMGSARSSFTASGTKDGVNLNAYLIDMCAD